MKKKILLIPAVAALMAPMISACGSSADYTLVVYNWEDYIATGEDSEGDKTDSSVIEDFEEYFKEKHDGKTIKVKYKRFSTNEEMYTKIKTGRVKPDICCPSDYMIQKMHSEDRLESFGFNSSTSNYESGLDNYNNYLSPYIKDLFKKNEFSDFAVPYFWGTMGYTYDPEHISAEQVSTWDFQWNPGAFLEGKGKIAIKDSVRDTYFTAVMHVYKDELLSLKSQYDAGTITAESYNNSLSEIFNRHDADTLSKTKAALKEIKKNVQFEVDEGKSDMVLGNIYANLAWSGDSVFAMDEAEKSNKRLCYAIPVEGSNVWFDGWCMLKGANVDASKEFLNFIADPQIAALNMSEVGYTSPIAGQDIWEYVIDTYSVTAYDGEYTEEDCDEIDLSYFFNGTLNEGVEAKILVPTEERGRQFDAQYPTAETIVRCAIMKDFGDEGNKAVKTMWDEFKA